MTSPSLPSRTICGLPYVNTTPQCLRHALHSLLAAPSSTPITIFTPNATIAAACRKSPALTSLIKQATFLLPDGIGVLWAARRAGTPLKSRLPGIETGEEILHIAAALALPVYFLGGKAGVARRAAEEWKRRLPTLPIAGTHHGYFGQNKTDKERVLASIQNSGARIVFVCLGFPIQEQWICDNAPLLPAVRIFLGLGGSFDVWAGDIPRAPRIFQRMGLEWLWRGLRSPKKLLQLPAMISYVHAAK